MRLQRVTSSEPNDAGATDAAHGDYALSTRISVVFFLYFVYESSQSAAA